MSSLFFRVTEDVDAALKEKNMENMNSPVNEATLNQMYEDLWTESNPNVASAFQSQKQVRDWIQVNYHGNMYTV